MACGRLFKIGSLPSRKIFSSVLHFATTEGSRNALRICARSSSILSHVKCSTSSKTDLLQGRPINMNTKLCSCGIHKLTEGDDDLLEFLKEEIEAEKGSIDQPPKFKNFKVENEGSRVILTRTHNGERIQVEFDLNENLNVDEPADGDDGEPASKIVSYPTFYVQLIKDSGKTLQFQCEFNTSMGVEDEDGEVADDMDEPFRFDNVCVLPRPDAKKAGISVYQAEAENMDGNLYSMLTNILNERGIGSGFVQTLLDFSTNLEHRQYVDFLEDLQDFVKEK